MQSTKKNNQILLTVGKSYCCYLRALAGSDCFLDDACFEFYLRRLLERSTAYRVNLHAYCLLANEAFLLLSPGTPFGVGDWLRSVNSCYGSYYRERYRRPSLVFPHLRSVSAINSDRAFLDCQKYLETEGARRHGLSHPGAYHWSSYSRHAFCCHNHRAGAGDKLSPNKATRAYLASGVGVLHDYREFIAADFSIPYLQYLSVWLRHGKALGIEPRSVSAAA